MSHDDQSGGGPAVVDSTTDRLDHMAVPDNRPIFVTARPASGRRHGQVFRWRGEWTPWATYFSNNEM